MFPRLIVACCLLLGLPGLAAARSVGQIPDPKRSGSHLADTTGRADAGTRARVDELIARARGRGYATEYHIDRYWREARLMSIAPVTQEMTLNYVAQNIMGLPRGY